MQAVFPGRAPLVLVAALLGCATPLVTAAAAAAAAAAPVTGVAAELVGAQPDAATEAQSSPASRAPSTGSLPCPDCNPPKRPLTAFGELMLVQAIPSMVNNVLRDAEWAKISPRVWYDNLQYPWQWDDNKFVNNQFSHPYHGNLYFNSARTNGYNFWASAPWSFGGSLMWELFGEGWAPSPNDLWNTSLGGISLGEMLWRVSSLTLDNTAVGSERTWREIGAAALNPIRGFNRLVRGEAGAVTANPPDWRPNFVQGFLELGYRRISGENSLTGDLTSDQAVVKLGLRYGDIFEDATKAPFSHFLAAIELSDKASQGERGRLSSLTARGTLAAKVLKDTPSKRELLAVLMRYEYYNNPAYEFGGQSFMAGWLGRFREQQSMTVRTEVLGSFYPIGASRSDVYTTEEGRDYDYGWGFGGTASARFVWWPRAAFLFGYTIAYINTLDGAQSSHTQGGGVVDLRFQVTRRWGAGISYFNYQRWSHYDDVAVGEVTQQSAQFNAFITLAIPAVEK